MLDIAILEGIRTPFAKAYGPLASVSATLSLPSRRRLRPDSRQSADGVFDPTRTLAVRCVAMIFTPLGPRRRHVVAPFSG